MRLIDAVALRNALIEWQMEYSEWARTEAERFTTIGEVIDLLEQMPTIDIDKITEAHESIGYEKGKADGYAEAIEDGEVKHGKWKPHPTEADWDVCSVCGLGTHRRFHYNEAVYGGYDVEESFAYCPNCGARMDG